MTIKTAFAGAASCLALLATAGTGRAEQAPSTVSAGNSHTCAIKPNGTLWCWGSNSAGQLGDGTTSDHAAPVQITALANSVAEVSAGDLFTCARKTDGTVYCWGSGSFGQLGNGGTSDSPVPVAVSLPSGASQISTGDLFACARTIDGKLYCWGSGGFLGDGTDAASATPVFVSSLGNAVAEVSVGDTAACARKTDGTLWCWGSNTFGIVGDGTNTDRSSPVQVTTLGTGVAEVSMGDLSACARKVDNSVFCWGTNDQGQLGIGTNGTHLTPVQVASLANTAAALSTNGRHACARRTDGTLWCWGWNASGELGDGTTVNRLTPVQVTSLASTVTEVSAGVNHDTCARKTDGSVWCWGANLAGNVGDGSNTDRHTPVQVTSFGPISAVPASDAARFLALAGCLLVTAWLRLRGRDEISEGA